MVILMMINDDTDDSVSMVMKGFVYFWMGVDGC